MLFGWTAPALRAGAQTQVRYAWSTQTASRFKAGAVVSAYDRPPRAGGKQIAKLRLLADPSYVPLSTMTERDYEECGWQWLYEHPEAVRESRFGGRVTQDDFSLEAFERWRSRPFSTWLVRFEILSVEKQMPLAA